MKYNSIYSPELFKDKVIIVTGGGSGIGRCTAHELAALGATVAIIGRDEKKLDTVVAEIVEDGGKASLYVCDIRDESLVVKTIESILLEHKKIDGLVNNAGGQFMAPMKDISTNGFEAVVRNNLTGGFIFMREVYTQWMENNGGSIVNIIADIWNGWPNFSHSAAARGGMYTLTQSAACEWAEAGVRVNTVAPGGIASSGFDRYTPESRKHLKKFAAKVPLKRFGTEAEVSSAIVYLLSPGAAYITGSCIRVDGGTPNARQTWPLGEESRNEPFNGFHRQVDPAMLTEDDSSQG